MSMEQYQVELVFVSGFHGKSKAGNEFNMTTFYQVVADKENPGKLKSTAMSFFTAEPLEWENYNFGDLVQVTVEPSEFLGKAPDLVSIDKIIKKSPYLT